MSSSTDTRTLIFVFGFCLGDLDESCEESDDEVAEVDQEEENKDKDFVSRISNTQIGTSWCMCIFDTLSL